MTGTPDTPVCDFCSSFWIVWEYPCIDFVVGGMLLDKTGKHVLEPPQNIMDSNESWLACERCSYYIDFQNWEALAEIVGYSSEQVKNALIVLWRAFYAYRKGSKLIWTRTT